MLFALTLCAMLLTASPTLAQLDLLKDVSKWTVNVDHAGATMAFAPVAQGMAVDVTAQGKQEDYPKVRLVYNSPQDWSGYARMRTRLRVTSADPSIRRKQIAFVFYDEKTRLTNYPGNPMRQQVLSHSVPVNRWVEVTNWLTTIQRTAIRQLDLYVYELPPNVPHKYRWEFATLDLEAVSGTTVVFDGQIFGQNEMKAVPGKPAGDMRTADGLALSLGSSGNISQVKSGAEVLGAERQVPTGLLVRDVTRDDPPVPVGGSVTPAGAELHQVSRLNKLGLAIDATYRSRGDYIEVAGSVTDLRGEDRAVTLYLALPVSDGAWKWWDSAAVSRTDPGAMGEFSNLETGMSYGLDGAHSKYPLGAISLPQRGGLTLAVRMDEPVVHRIGYSPKLRLFYLALDFGLVNMKRTDGSSLSTVPFRILLYRHDPAWGFRSALQRYYGFFPEFFTQRVKRQGGWYVWGDMSKTAGALDAGFGFHWGPSDPNAVKWDNAHGPLALFYIEPETYQQTMEDFDHAPSYEDAITRFRKLVAGDKQEIEKVAGLPYRIYPLASGGELSARIRQTAQVVERSLSYDSGGDPYCSIGRYDWMQKSKWGAIFACSLSPGIPEGKGWFNRTQIIAPALRTMEAAGAHYDGIGLDSFGGYGELSRADYRREHFAHSRFPLSFSAQDHQPVEVAAFATVAWVEDLAKEMHAQGKVLMANCSWGTTPGWLTFAAPYLDIFGAEAPKFADPDFIRAIACRKSCTDLPYKPRPAWEVPWHLLQDIYPGHGNDLKEMSRYADLLRELAAEGWEPITGAAVQPDTLRTERYGSGGHGPVFVVVHNPTDQPVTGEVILDVRQLGFGAAQLTVVQVPEKREIALSDGRLNLHLAGHETVAVRLVARGA